MPRFLLPLLLVIISCLAGCGGGGGGTTEVESFPPVSISYPAFGPFMLGSAISPIDCIVVGGTPDLWTVTPNLPAGLNLDPLNGTISGTPLVVQAPTPHTIFAENESGQVTVVVTIFVLPASPCDLDYGATVIQLIEDASIVPLIPTNGCGAADLWSIDPPLPTGLTLNPISGAISGTPIDPATALEYQITAENAFGQGVVMLTIEVLGTAPCDLQYPQSTITLQVGDPLVPQQPQSGCGDVAEFSILPPLPAGLSLDAVTGIISGTATQVSNATLHQVTAINPYGADQQALTITVLPASPCDLSYSEVTISLGVGDTLAPMMPTVSCGPVDGFSVFPALPAGLSLDPTTGAIGGVAIEESAINLYQIVASNVSGQAGFDLELEVLPQAPCDLQYPETTLNLLVGVALDDQIPAVGCGQVTLYQIFPALPAGLSIDSISGVISGTALETSNSTNYEIVASNFRGSSSTTITITVLPELPCGLQYPQVDVVLTVGESMAVLSPTSSCGPIDVYTAIPPLPTGISLGLATGVISGIPQFQSGRSDHVIIGGNASGSTSTTINITVNPQAPCGLQYDSSLLSLVLGEDLGTLLPTVACGDVDNWIVSPDLPAGLIFDGSSGAISGTPTDLAVATDHLIEGSNVSGSTNFTISIEVVDAAPCDLLYPDPALLLILGDALSLQIPSVGCGSPDQFEIDPPLPQGLSFDSLTGAIEGTPTTVTAATLHQVTATNGTGFTSTDLSIEVIGQGPCELFYPESVVAHPAGIPIPIQVPQIGCGAVDLWTITPDLPDGLDFDPLTGIISGAANSEGESSHLIRAENAFGEVETTLQIILRDVFWYHADPFVLEYSIATGEGSTSVPLKCEESIANPNFPTQLAGISMAIQYDSQLLESISVDQGTSLAILNGGTGPDFWAVNPIDGAILIGALVSFTFNDVLVCDVDREIAVVNFGSNAINLQGNATGVSGSLPWGNPGSVPPLDNLVVIDGTTSVDPVLRPVEFQLLPQ